MNCQLYTYKTSYWTIESVCMLSNSYLSNRDQNAACDEYKSNSLHLNAGVSRRFALGSLLLNIFINSISQLGKMFFGWHCLLYKDELFIKLFETIKLFVSTLSKHQKLDPHETNTKLLLFTSWIRPALPDIRFNENYCEWVSVLGIVFDNKLTLKLYISSICRHLHAIRGITYSVSGFLIRKSLLTHYSWVYCHLSQSIVNWGGASEHNIRSILAALNNYFPH